jgi:galactose mutarotase-like enzyme
MQNLEAGDLSVFAIATEQRQYKTYILTDLDASSRLEVVPERGGIITSWQVQGQELLYLDAERFNHPEMTVRGGIPILFPICGNLPNNTYTHRGQTYTLKQHGFARDLPWEVTNQSTETEAAITLTLTSQEQTRQVYPFEFEVVFTYQIQGNLLNLKQRYTNLSDQPMPFSTGFHPYFQVADKQQLQFEIPAAQLKNQIDQTVHPFSGQFDFELDEIDAAFRPLTQPSAQAIDQQRKIGLTLDYDSSIYSTLVFWTVKGKDFYCLEPWSAPRNALNTGEDLIQLAPNTSLETSVRLSARFL